MFQNPGLVALGGGDDHPQVIIHKFPGVLSRSTEIQKNNLKIVKKAVELLFSEESTVFIFNYLFELRWVEEIWPIGVSLHCIESEHLEEA